MVVDLTENRKCLCFHSWFSLVKIFMEELCTALAFGSELQRWDCQLKAYETEKNGMFLLFLGVGLWALEFLTPCRHTDSQCQPPAHAANTVSIFHLCFPMVRVCPGVSKNPLSWPKIKHPEFDILIPILPLAHQHSQIRQLSGLCLKQSTK